MASGIVLAQLQQRRNGGTMLLGDLQGQKYRVAYRKLSLPAQEIHFQQDQPHRRQPQLLVVESTIFLLPTVSLGSSMDWFQTNTVLPKYERTII